MIFVVWMFRGAQNVIFVKNYKFYRWLLWVVFKQRRTVGCVKEYVCIAAFLITMNTNVSPIEKKIDFYFLRSSQATQVSQYIYGQCSLPGDHVN